MPILFNEQTKEFHLYNDEVSYIMNILPNHQYQPVRSKEI